MGGITGFILSKETDLGELIIPLLKELSYLGLDGKHGAGVAFISRDPLRLRYIKDVTLNDFERMLREECEACQSRIAIANVRFATHGRPFWENTQPLLDCTGSIAVVMDGVIADYDKHSDELRARGHSIVSRNDTELLAHAFEETMEKISSKKEILLRVLKKFEGYFAAAIITTAFPDKILLISKGPTIYVGFSDAGIYFSSELDNMVGLASKYITIERGEIGVLTSENVYVYDFMGERKDKEPNTMHEKKGRVLGGYDFYMLREIMDIPDALYRTLYVHQDRYMKLICDILKKSRKIYIIGSGGSYYAALLGSYLFRLLSDIAAESVNASEFRYYALKDVYEDTTIIALSPSGADRDVIYSVKSGKFYGAKIIGILNILGSPLMYRSDAYLPLGIGPEKAVPATKSFLGQLLTLYKIALKSAELKDTAMKSSVEVLRDHLYRIPKLARDVILDACDRTKEIAKAFAKKRSIFVLSRGLNYPIALEGALILKEAAGVHAEGIEAVDIVYGPLSLLGHEVGFVIIVPWEMDARARIYSMLEKELRDAREDIVIITDREDRRADAFSQYVIKIPKIPDTLTPLINIIPLQLLSYWMGIENGRDVDKPPRLSKYVSSG